MLQDLAQLLNKPVKQDPPVDSIDPQYFFYDIILHENPKYLSKKDQKN